MMSSVRALKETRCHHPVTHDSRSSAVESVPSGQHPSLVVTMRTCAVGSISLIGLQGGMFGYSGDHPPGDVEGHVDFIKSLRQPDVWEV